MQMAIDVAGFTAAEADQLRQAMGSKRSNERMDRLRERFYDGMAERGIAGAVADQIWDKLAAFANFGFPESHSVSFAYLVYASSWIKLHHPAAFCAALLNAQPMGFYSPDSLVADARRHGVEVRTPDLNASEVDATLVWPTDTTTAAGRQVVRDAAALVGEVFDGAADEAADGSCVVERDRTRRRHPSAAPALLLSFPDGPTPAHPAPVSDDAGSDPGEGDPHGATDAATVVGPQPTVQLGLSSVRHLSTDMAERLVAERRARGPFTSMEDLRRRLPVPLDVLEALATAGAFGGLRDSGGRPLDRRRALWAAGAVAQTGPERLEGVVTGAEAPELVPMTEQESALADLWATGVAPGGHPLQFLRQELSRQGIVTAVDLRQLPGGGKVRVAGVVTHRQRPATAGGTTFLNLEDETGFVNVVCSLGCWQHHRSVVRTAPALVVRGRLESSEGVVNVVAERITPLGIEATVRSRDFR